LKIKKQNVPDGIFVYEDDTLLLNKKKPGMVVHPDMETMTLVHALAYHFDNCNEQQ
jgi:23S rRNA-/tRNA-specific pseudouridylate synthase